MTKDDAKAEANDLRPISSGRATARKQKGGRGRQTEEQGTEAGDRSRAASLFVLEFSARGFMSAGRDPDREGVTWRTRDKSHEMPHLGRFLLFVSLLKL